MAKKPTSAPDNLSSVAQAAADSVKRAKSKGVPLAAVFAAESDAATVRIPAKTVIKTVSADDLKPRARLRSKAAPDLDANKYGILIGGLKIKRVFPTQADAVEFVKTLSYAKAQKARLVLVLGLKVETRVKVQPLVIDEFVPEKLARKAKSAPEAEADPLDQTEDDPSETPEDGE